MVDTPALLLLAARYLAISSDWAGEPPPESTTRHTALRFLLENALSNLGFIFLKVTDLPMVPLMVITATVGVVLRRPKHPILCS